MEDALVHPIKEVKAVRVDGVLILVLMEDALVLELVEVTQGMNES